MCVNVRSLLLLGHLTSSFKYWPRCFGFLYAPDATEVAFSLGQLTFKRKLIWVCYIALKRPLSRELFEDTAFALFIKVVIVPSICDCIL